MNDLMKQFQITVKKGTILYKNGELSQDLYMIISGKVQLDGKEKVILTDDDVSFFGELSALLKTPREETATALEDCILFKIPQSSLKTCLSQLPSTAIKLAESLAKRIEKLLSRGNEHVAEKIYQELTATSPYVRFLKLCIVKVGSSIAIREAQAAAHPSQMEADRILETFEKHGLITRDSRAVRFHECPDKVLWKFILEKNPI